MRVFTRTLLCVIASYVSVLPIVIFVLASTTIPFGPSESLKLTGVDITIDTWGKYIGLISITIFLKISGVVIGDIGSPTMGFSIYNPTTTTVYGFTLNQLWTLSTFMWFSQAVKGVFNTLILTSRLDIAIIGIIGSELASIVVVRYLLSTKDEFILEFDTKGEYDEFHKNSSVIVEIDSDSTC